MRRRSFARQTAIARALAGTFALACAAASCAPAGSPRQANTTLTIGGAEPESLDPIFSNAIGQNNLLRLMFEPLIAADRNGNPEPALAAVVPTVSNGGISADGRTITYHLRHDVLWHDGVRFTSRDIAFSTRAMLDPDNPVASRRGYDQIAAVSTPDDYTVRVRLRARFAPFVSTYFSESDFPIYPVPAHVLERARPLNRAAFSAAPIGTGPFRFVRWDRGNRIVMTANTSYFRGAPAVQTLVWRISSDENTTLAQLRSGEIDMVQSLSAVAAAQLTGVPHVRVVATPINGYLGLMFDTQRVADVRVRRAIAEAIDAAGVRRTIAHGFERPAVADLPAFLWAFDARLRPIPYDVADAQRLMRAAGYGPERSYPLALAIIAGRRTDAAWAVLLQATLARIGVAVCITPYNAIVYGATLSEHGILASGRYDATPYTWIAGTDPDDSSQFQCDQRPPGGNNVAFYCSAAMDAAQRDALTHYDRPTRKRAYARIESLLLRDVPIVFVGAGTDLTALSDRVAGFAPNPVTPSADAQRWTVTGRRAR